MRQTDNNPVASFHFEELAVVRKSFSECPGKNSRSSSMCSGLGCASVEFLLPNKKVCNFILPAWSVRCMIQNRFCILVHDLKYQSNWRSVQRMLTRIAILAYRQFLILSPGSIVYQCRAPSADSKQVCFLHVGVELMICLDEICSLITPKIDLVEAWHGA